MIFFNDLWRLSLLKLRVRRKRLWFTVIGVGLGVGLVALATTLIYNGKGLMLKKATEQLFDLTIIKVSVGPQVTPFSRTMPSLVANPEDTPKLSDADIQKIQTLLPTAQNVSPEIEMWNSLAPFPLKEQPVPLPPLNSPIMRWQKEVDGKELIDVGLESMRGIDDSIFKQRVQITAVAASDEIPLIISPFALIQTLGSSQQLRPSGIFMREEDYAEYLGKKIIFVFEPGYVGEAKPADLPSREINFLIVGVNMSGSYIPIAAARELQQWIYDETLKNIPLDMQANIQVAQKPNAYNTINVVVPSLRDVTDSVSLLEASGYQTYSYNNLVHDINEMFRYAYYGVMTAGSVIILIVLFIVMNTIGKMVSDSTKEIGIFKTLGATKSDIRKIFMTQAFIITGLGSAVGVVLGYLGAPLAVYLFLSFIARLDPADNSSAVSGAQEIAANFFGFPWLEFLVLWLVTVLICTLVSFGRAQRAAKLNPVNALKEEA